MEVLLDLSDSEGDFKPVEDLEGHAPVPKEEAVENIKKSALIDVPLFKKHPARDDIAVYVGAGATMPAFIEDIRKKKEDGYFIITSNMTNDWLVERGIIPNAVLVIDPKERIKNYIQKPQRETKFYVGVVCNEGVAKGLIEKGADVEKLLVAYGEGEEDIALQEELYGERKDYLIGGTMTGLRIMNFAVMLGFRKIEMYGVDSCFSSEAPQMVTEDDPLYEEAVKSNAGAFYVDPQTKKKYAIYDHPEGGWFYAYKKKHHGSLQVAKCPDGRMFWTSPVFAHQAKQFIKWWDRFEGKLEITVHGDSLTANLLKCHIENIEKRKSKIEDKILTDKYKPVFLDFFKDGKHMIFPDIVQLAVQNGITAMGKSLERELTIFNYDKHVYEDKQRIGEHDLVFSVNLLEHIERECIDNVLSEIKKLSKYMTIIKVGIGESEDKLSDGRDSHITQKSPQWWEQQIGRYFDIIEGQWKGGDYALFICQSLAAKENQAKEKKIDITKKIDAVTKIGEERIQSGGVQPPPKSVKIELTSKCNLRCKFCAVRTREKQPNKDMDLWLFKKITEDMRISGVEEIGLFYLGESFCSPNLLVDALKWCKNDLKFNWVFLTTNATLAKTDVVGELFENGLDSLKWSVNFDSPETFADVTQSSGQLFHKALENIKSAWELKQTSGCKTLISASSILYEGEQRDRMEKLLNEKVRPYVDKHYWLPLYQMSMYKEEIQKTMGYTPTAGNCGRLKDSTLTPTRLPLPCWCVFTEGHVRYDGGLSACGFGADGRFDMGLLDGTNFMRQWNSPKFTALREAQLRTLSEGQKALQGTPCEVCVAWG